MDTKSKKYSKTEIKARKSAYRKAVPSIEKKKKEKNLIPNIFLDIVAPILIFSFLLQSIFVGFEELMIRNFYSFKFIEIIFVFLFSSFIYYFIKTKKNRVISAILIMTSVLFLYFFIFRFEKIKISEEYLYDVLVRMITLIFAILSYIFIKFLIKDKRRGFIKAAVSICSIYIFLDTMKYLANFYELPFNVNTEKIVVYFVCIIIILLIVTMYNKSHRQLFNIKFFYKFRISHLIFSTAMLSLFLITFLINPLNLKNETSDTSPKTHLQNLADPALKIYDFILNDAKLKLPTLSPENFYKILDWLDLADPADWSEENISKLLEFFQGLPEDMREEFMRELLEPPMSEGEKELLDKILSEMSPNDFSSEELAAIQDSFSKMSEEDQSEFEQKFNDWIAQTDDEMLALDEQSKIVEELMGGRDPNSLTEDEWAYYEGIVSSLDSERHKDVIDQFEEYKGQVDIEIVPPPIITCKICPENTARNLTSSENDYRGVVTLINLQATGDTERDRVIYPTKTISLNSDFNTDVLLEEYGIVAHDYNGNPLPMSLRSSNVNVNIVGTYEVVYFAVDGKGNESESDHVIPVVVEDNMAPSISGATNLDYLVYFDNVPNWKNVFDISDNYDTLDNISVEVSRSFKGEFFQIEDSGIYDVYFTAVDSSGNRSAPHKVTFSIQKEAIPPTISGPNEIVLNTHFNKLINWNYLYTTFDFIKLNPDVTHIENNVILYVEENIPKGEFGTYNVVGTYNVILTATDRSGNSTVKNVTVIIENETIPPSISCPDSIDLYTYFSVYPTWEFTCDITDNISDVRNQINIEDNDNLSQLLNLSNGYIQEVYVDGMWKKEGSIEITVTATDYTGNSSSTTVILNVALENVPPEINYDEAEIIKSTGSISGTSIDDLSITYFTSTVVPDWHLIFTGVDGPFYTANNYAFISFESNSLFVSNGIFTQEESFILTVRATDISGNITIKNIPIQIIDDVLPPTITINDELPTWFLHRTGDVPTNVQLLNYFSINDNKDGIIQPLTSMLSIKYKETEGAVGNVVSFIDVNISGFYIVRLTTSDSANNTTFKEITIEVGGADVKAPTITVNPSNLPVEFLHRVGDVPTTEFIKRYFKIVDNKDGIILDIPNNIDNTDLYSIQIIFDPEGVNNVVSFIDVMQSGVYKVVITASDYDENSTNNSLTDVLLMTVLPKDTIAPVVNNNISQSTCYDTEYDICLSEDYLISLLDIEDNIDKKNLEISWTEISDNRVDGLGKYSINIYISDLDGNEIVHFLEYTFEYDTPPKIKLKAGVLLEFYEGQNSISWSEYFNITDNNSVANTTYVFLGDLLTPAIYVDLLEVRATDNYGRETVEYFTVTILDITPPTIEYKSTCNGSTITPDGKIQFAEKTPYFNFEICFQVTDISEISDQSIAHNIIINEGLMTSINTFEVTLTATDIRGNAASLTLSVKITDITAPTIENTTPLIFDESTQLPNFDNFFDFFDNYSPKSKLVYTYENFGIENMTSPGVHTIKVTVIDEAGNKTEADYFITINDITPPVIMFNDTCPITTTQGDVPVAVYPEKTPEVDWNSCFTVSDESSIDRIVIDSEVPIKNGFMNDIGYFSINVKAIDVYNNESVIVFFVRITDTTSPIITYIKDEIVVVQADYNNIKPNWNSVLPEYFLISDNYDTDITITHNLVSAVDGSLTMYILGQYNMQFYVYDNANNMSNTVFFTLEVVDTQAPLVLGNESVELSYNSHVPDFLSKYIIKDNYDGNIPLQSSMMYNNINTAILGNYTLVITATDSNGNTVEKNILIKVIDNVSPKFESGPTSIKVRKGNKLPNLASQFVFTDNYDSEVNIEVDTLDFNSNTLGIYYIKIIAKDSSGNSSTRILEVEVIKQAFLTKLQNSLIDNIFLLITALLLISTLIIFLAYRKRKKEREIFNSLTDSQLIIYYSNKIIRRLGKKFVPIKKCQTISEYERFLRLKHNFENSKSQKLINIIYKAMYSKMSVEEDDMLFVKDFYYTGIGKTKVENEN